MIEPAPRLPDRFTQPLEEAAEARGEAKLLLVILSSRGLEITSDQRRVIENCTDTKQLEAWAVRGLSVGSVIELLGTVGEG
jgi:hypothetical protein